MKNQSRIVLWAIMLMECMAGLAVIISAGMLYKTSFEQTRNQLADTVKSHANLIEAVARFDKKHIQNDDADAATGAALSQIVDAHRRDSGYGETGEFTLATLKDDSIVFLLSHRHEDGYGTLEQHEAVPMSGTLAEPMRRALQGGSGTIVGLDYRGESVLAAYEPIAELNCGIVAKIDVAEIRRPFLTAGAFAVVVVALMIWAVGIVIVKPLVSRLAESTARITAIIETATDPILTISGRGLIKSFNPAAERVFGYSKTEVLEQNVKLLIPSPFREEHDDNLKRFWKTRETNCIGFSREVVGQRKDGTTLPVHLSVSQVVMEGENILFTAIIRNLTVQKQAEVELTDAKEAAETANRSKSEFLANMSHEIRTPMTAILGFNDIILDNVTDPENIDAARTVKENGEFLIELINDILDLSKIEAGKLDVEQIDCSPHEFVADLSSLMNVRATAKGLPLKVRFDGPLPETIRTDPTRLRQILINILGNAIKFTETGSVELVIRLLSGPQGEPKLQFDVIDTGIGISEDQTKTLFLPFTQADSSTTRRFGGTGLGLAISQRMAELLGGSVSVSSTVGKGSTFSVTVSTGPLANVCRIDGVANLTDENLAAAGVSEIETLLQNCRILFAEDGPSNQRLISYILRKAGADVTIAENGQVAIDKVHAVDINGAAFDVILMDMQMPILDGYAATRQLRQEGYAGPIIALTAHAMSTDRRKCLDAGCDDFSTKPIDRNKLIAMIKTHSNGEAAMPKQQQLPTVLVSELADDDDMLELVEMFVDELPEKIAAIERAIDERNLPALGVLSHRMKGAAGGYGFPTLTDAAQLLNASVQDSEDLATVAEQARALVDLCSRARATVPAV